MRGISESREALKHRCLSLLPRLSQLSRIWRSAVEPHKITFSLPIFFGIVSHAALFLSPSPIFLLLYFRLDQHFSSPLSSHFYSRKHANPETDSSHSVRRGDNPATFLTGVQERLSRWSPALELTGVRHSVKRCRTPTNEMGPVRWPFCPPRFFPFSKSEPQSHATRAVVRWLFNYFRGGLGEPKKCPSPPQTRSFLWSVLLSSETMAPRHAAWDARRNLDSFEAAPLARSTPSAEPHSICARGGFRREGLEGLR